MKKVLLFLFFMVLVPFAINAQDDESPISLGLNAGYDYDINALRLNNNALKVGINSTNYYDGKGSFYAIKSHWNIGADFGVMVSKKLRPRFEMKFVKMSYGFTWDDSYPSWTKTEVKLYCMDLNLHLDYLLLNSPKLTIFASPAIKNEFVSSTYYKTYKRDGDTEGMQPSDLNAEYPKAISGAAFSMIFKYNVTKNIGITFIPEYTYFFRKYQIGNDKAYERLSTNLGFEYRF